MRRIRLLTEKSICLSGHPVRKISAMTTIRAILTLAITPLLPAVAADAAPERDPHSFSRPEGARVRHLDLDLRVDFEKRILAGQVTLKLDNPTGARALHLDAKGL